MTDTIRNLLISLSSHMAYMQGQLEAHHELDDLDDFYWFRKSLALRQKVADALADEPAVPEVVGSEWKPCVKLPITVHVREQRPGEQHVSTREGITPVQPDDLIMRGVAGEEYPIGRDLFQRTYRMGSAEEPAVPDGGGPDSDTGRPSDEEVLRLAQHCSVVYLWSDGSACTPFQDGYDMRGELIAFARALLARWGSPAPAPQATPISDDANV